PLPRSAARRCGGCRRSRGRRALPSRLRWTPLSPPPRRPAPTPLLRPPTPPGRGRRRVRLSVPLRGTGRVEVAAYGVADAEHLVQTELERLWPGARVRVPEVRRTGEEPRIVEEFEVS